MQGYIRGGLIVKKDEEPAPPSSARAVTIAVSSLLPIQRLDEQRLIRI
jgi:hypothetical protein